MTKPIDGASDGGNPDIKYTKHVRVSRDIAEWVEWIRQFRNEDEGKDLTIAQVLDPILRAVIWKMYVPYQDRAETIKRAKKGQTGQTKHKPPKD